MDAVNRMDIIKSEIEQKALRPLYLFYGEETFLIDTYLKRIRKLLLNDGDELMNLDEMEGQVSEEAVISSAETFPFMVDKRLVIVHDSGFFAGGECEALCNYFPQVPDTTVLIFVESKVDKRSRAYKTVDKSGLAVEFTKLSEEALAKWIMIEARRRRLKMDRMTAQYFIRAAGTDMNDLSSEMEKLFSYKEGTGLVTDQDIDRIVTLSLETNIFHMMDAIGNQRVQEAYRIYRNLLKAGESEQYIFALLRRQIDLLYKTSVYRKDQYDAGEIARLMKVQPFVARKNLQQASRFSEQKLVDAMEETLRYDTAIKNGGITPGRAIELLIAKYGSRMSAR